MNTIHTQSAARQNGYLNNYEKGSAFEHFIITLFNEHSFHLKKWRKAGKLPDFDFPFDHADPDLEIELVFAGARKYRFAVECKWRKEFIGDRISWATSEQIWRYEEFQNHARMPVFVAIGIGGDPHNPEKLFVTPLNNICQYTEVYEPELIPFRRRPGRKFFYDIRQGRLF